MLENKNAQAVFLGILTTALTRVFGMSATDSAILGGLIIGLARLYFNVIDWVKSTNSKIENNSSSLVELKESLSKFALNSTRTLPNTDISSDVDTKAESKAEIALTIINGVTSTNDDPTSTATRPTVSLNDNVIQSPKEQRRK